MNRIRRAISASILLAAAIRGFQMDSHNPSRMLRCLSSHSESEKSSTTAPEDTFSSRVRRNVLKASVFASTASLASPALADDGFRPAVRPLAYRVDSTTPPTLLPLKNSQQQQILEGLAKGSGTDKKAIVIDTLNLNNMLNKAVFGTIDYVKQFSIDSGPSGPSFLCLSCDSLTDATLASQLLFRVLQYRANKRTALGLSFVPYSAQLLLTDFATGKVDLDTLVMRLKEAGVDESILSDHRPLLENIRPQSIDLLALSPEFDDIKVVRSQGLQEVDPERRSRYVIDPDGFIALTQDPSFKLYTDRSLFKDFSSIGKDDSFGNFFSERILVHEAGASAMARYTAEQPAESLVIMVSPTKDVRYLQGINGRVPRVTQFLLDQRESKFTTTEDSVTTILLNPTAKETLSQSRRLRLEIGTAPENLDYQSKLADYLWFSQMPKVNLIPRLMDS